MALILIAATAYCATKAFEKLNSSDASDDSITDDSKASSSHLTKSQKERARRSKLSNWHCNRINTREGQKSQDDQAVDRADRVLQEEQAHNELSRPGSMWRPRQLRGEAPASRWAGRCCRKVYRTQSDVWSGCHKADPSSNGVLTSVMLLLISVMQQDSSRWELATVAAASMITTASMAMMLCGTVMSLYGCTSSIQKWNVKIRALVHDVLAKCSSSQSNHRRGDSLHSVLCGARSLVLPSDSSFWYLGVQIDVGCCVLGSQPRVVVDSEPVVLPCCSRHCCRTARGTCCEHKAPSSEHHIARYASYHRACGWIGYCCTSPAHRARVL